MSMPIHPAIASLFLLLVAVPAGPARGQGSADQTLRAARLAAIDEALAASRNEDPFLRSNAIEALQPELERVTPLVQLGLDDPHPAVRFAALVSIGKLNLVELGPSAARLLHDRSPSVRAAAMYATHATGLEPQLRELPALLMSPNPGVRRNATMVVGLMGDRSAIPMLKEVATTPMPRVDATQQSINRLQVALAILQLGDDGTIDTIRAGVFYAADSRIRAEAITMLGTIKDYEMVAAFVPLLKDETIEVRLAAATTLARLGRDSGLNVLLEGANFTPADVREMAEDYLDHDNQSQTAEAFRQLLNDPEELQAVAIALRSQAAFGLGELNEPAAARQLVRMLEDPSPQVRVSAAAAILQAVSIGSEPASSS